MSDLSASEVTENNPGAAANTRVMMGVVIGLGVVLVIGLGVLVYGLLAGWGKQDTAAVSVSAKKPVTMTLAPGFRILSSDTQPGRLILHVRSDTMDEIDIIDLNDGRIISQIHAEVAK